MEIRKTNVQLDDELSRMEEYFINDMENIPGKTGPDSG